MFQLVWGGYFCCCCRCCWYADNVVDLMWIIESAFISFFAACGLPLCLIVFLFRQVVELVIDIDVAAVATAVHHVCRRRSRRFVFVGAKAREGEKEGKNCRRRRRRKNNEMTDISIYIRFVFTILQIDLEAETGEEVKNKCQTNNWWPSLARASSSLLSLFMFVFIYICFSIITCVACRRATNQPTNERTSDWAIERMFIFIHTQTLVEEESILEIIFRFLFFAYHHYNINSNSNINIKIRSRWKFAKNSIFLSSSSIHVILIQVLNTAK